MRHWFQGQLCHLCLALYFHQLHTTLHCTTVRTPFHWAKMGKITAPCRIENYLKGSSSRLQQGAAARSVPTCWRPNRKFVHLQITNSISNKEDIRLGNIYFSDDILSEKKRTRAALKFPGILLLFFRPISCETKPR